MPTKFSPVLTVAALAMLGAGACGDDKPNPTTAEVLAPPPAGQGVQLKMVSSLAPGLETERCMFYKVPAESLYVNREVVKYSAGSHHVLLYTTPYTEIPTQNLQGDTVDTADGKIFECGVLGATGHWNVNGVAGGAQSADAPPIVGGLPADTAVKLDGGTILLMNTHYINASADKTLETTAAINLYTMAAADVKTEAGMLFFYDPYIRVPAMSDAVAHEVCPIGKDINIVNAQSHMHRRGVSYTATLLDANLQPGAELFKGNSWEQVIEAQMAPPMAIPAGSFIDYHCEYHNTENRLITQGLTTKDEMCMFIGLYYPRDRKTELCSITNDWSGAFLSAMWIGNGASDGATTAGCLQGAKATSEDHGDSFYGCVVNSCAGVAKPMSDAARCLASSGLGMCTEMCKTDKTACNACISTQCGPSLQTLAAKSCP